MVMVRCLSARFAVALLKRGAIAAIILSTASCATVSVQKLGADGNPGGPDGIRFYRPRPYVAIHEPFPVFAKTYLASGRLTPDGKYVLVTDIPDALNAALKDQLKPIAEEKALRSKSVLLAPSGSGSQQGLADAIKKGTDQAPAASNQPAAQPAEPEKPSAKPAEKVGQANIRVTNDNFAFALQPMRRYFDVVYLPDFDENYVVQVKSRLGNANVGIAMGQGWSLQGLDAQLDNDAVVKRVFQFYDDAYKILTGVAKSALGLPPIPGGTPQGLAGKPSTVETLEGGTAVSLRITVVRMASPGLYPILKPAELEKLQERLSGDKLTEEQKAELASMVVPIAPATNIAFHTFQAMIIEAVPADGDSAYRITQYGGGTVPPLGSMQPATPPTADGQSQVKPEEIRKAVMDSAAAKAIPLKDVVVTFQVKDAKSVALLKFTTNDGQPLKKEDSDALIGAANAFLESRQSKTRAQAAE